jgi:nitric oxide reductase subunit C
MDCHTFFGIGAYYAPDLTKAWLDPAWETWKAITAADNREEAMVRFLMDPVRYRIWERTMPNLHLSRDEAEAVVAYLKWMSAIDTNGFPANFGRRSAGR